jgi:hypothetical protein
MIWVAIAVALVLWVIGLIAAQAGLLGQFGPLVNLLLVVAAILLVVQVVNERDRGA